MTLNDGGTALYQTGSSTNTLTFYYHVAAGQNIASLAATTVNLPSGATINDSAGNAANLSLTGLSQSGPQIDTTAPTVTSLVASPAKAALNTGKTVALTLNFSEPVTVAGGQPTLTLNDRGTATYVSGSGSKALTFNYTVAAGQNIASLAAARVTLASGATIKDSAGTNANLSLGGLTQSGPQIDTTTPAVTSVVASPGTGTQLPGDSVTITVKMSEAVTVRRCAHVGLKRRRVGKIHRRIRHQHAHLQVYRRIKRQGCVGACHLGCKPARRRENLGRRRQCGEHGWRHSFVCRSGCRSPNCEHTKPDGSYDVAYSEVTGLSYSSYEDIFNSAGTPSRGGARHDWWGWNVNSQRRSLDRFLVVGIARGDDRIGQVQG